MRAYQNETNHAVREQQPYVAESKYSAGNGDHSLLNDKNSQRTAAFSMSSGEHAENVMMDAEYRNRYHQETKVENRYSVNSAAIRNSMENHFTDMNDKSKAVPFSSLPNASKIGVQSSNLILLICGDANASAGLKHFLEGERFHVHECSVKELSSLGMPERFATVLIDLTTCGMPLDTLIPYLETYLPTVSAIFMDEPHNDSDRRSYCIQHSFSYHIKPCNREELLHDIWLGIKHSRILRENVLLRSEFGVPTQQYEMFESQTSLRSQYKQITAYAKLDGTVLITGERGTGKGITAQKIHAESNRRHKPLIVVQCDSLPMTSLDALIFGYTRGAFPEFSGERIGLLELAQGGTIYFDVISEMPLPIQQKLFRFLSDRQFRRNGSETSKILDTRILASSRIDPALACVQKTFLEELYYKLNSMVIHLPSLRDLVSEIPTFAKTLLYNYAKQNKSGLLMLSSGALTKLQSYSWPGNFREFHTVLYTACTNAKDSVITEHDITFDASQLDVGNTGKVNMAGITMAELERRLIIETITACGGNRAESARRLGISEKTIYNKFKQYKLKGVV
ncbi:MAG: sigma 54-interacting transcriptional regulator [Planctomycetaceae bacterium]|nr:sigma 54-interacting transcriptional regulator [Planctomycetaceae bacterium]